MQNAKLRNPGRPGWWFYDKTNFVSAGEVSVIFCHETPEDRRLRRGKSRPNYLIRPGKFVSIFDFDDLYMSVNKYRIGYPLVHIDIPCLVKCSKCIDEYV